MTILVKLTELQERIYQYILEQGIASTVVIRLLFKTTQLTVDRTMDKLISASLVIRPSKGIVLSSQWIKNNPDHVHWIENDLLYQISAKEGRKK